MGYFNRRRANSVAIPDEPLNNIKICSGIAEMILSGQFDDDTSFYRQLFSTFLITRYKRDLLDFDEEVLRKIDEYAVKTNKNNSPSSFATLMEAEKLDGEIGAAIQNAIIFSIAMSIATKSKTADMRDLIDGTSFIRGAKKTKTNEEYRTFMLFAHPRASAIAETIGHLESKSVAHNVVTIMGYLIDKADIGINETEQQRGLRIFDEQKIGA